ncbi:hypothetical protein ACTOV4_16390 [Brucella sp. C7-11G]
MDRTFYTPTGIDTQALMEGAAEMQLSTAGVFSESFVSGALQSYGLGTAIRNFSLPISPQEAERAGVDAPKALTADEYKASPYYRTAIPWDESTTEDRAAAKAAWYDAEQVRQRRIGQTNGWVSSFAGGIAGQATDPINYIPFLGPAARAYAVGRLGVIGGRMATAAADAALNTAAFGLATQQTRQSLGDDATFQQLALDVASAAAIGAVFGGVGGIRQARRLKRESAALRNITDTHAALNDAVGSLVTQGEVRLSDPTIAGMSRMSAADPEPDLNTFVFADSKVTARAQEPAGQNDVRVQSRADADPNALQRGAGEPALNNAPRNTEANPRGGDESPSIAQKVDADELWQRVEHGETAIDGRPSPALQAADFIRDAGGLTDRAQFDQFLKDVDAVPHTGEYQQQMRELVQRYIPEANRSPVMPRPKLDGSMPPAPAIDQAVVEAEKRVGRGPRRADDIARDHGIDPATGHFPEVDEVEALRNRGRLTPEDERAIVEAQTLLRQTEHYNDALKAAHLCEVA